MEHRGDVIYLLQAKGEPLELSAQPYDAEKVLQHLLADHPSLLPGAQIDESTPRKWLLVSLEMGVPSEEGGGSRFALDHLFLDQDGIPTFVEVKRSSDTRIRREVVGQMLDYAANGIVYWPLERIQAAFAATCREKKRDPEDTLTELLGSDADHVAFWQKVKTNLQAGRVRLVFVADVIPPELARIVEFLNNQMDPAEVLAVQIGQYVGGKEKALVPRLIGQTEEAKIRKGGGSLRRQWDESSFFEEAGRRLDQQRLRAIRRLYEASREVGDGIDFGTGTESGSFSPKFLSYSENAFFMVTTDGALILNFDWHRSEVAVRARDRFKEGLDRMALCPLPEDYRDRRFFRIAVEVWTPKVERLVSVIREVFAENPKAEGKGAGARREGEHG